MATGKDFGSAVGAAILGIVGGIAIAAILDALTSPKCPVCKNAVQRGVPVCPHCSSFLRWSSQ